MSEHQPFHYHSLAELRAAIAELGVEVPVADDIAPLLEAVEAGGYRLPNRLVVLPMEGCDGMADGSPDELTFRRYRRFAAGGAGLLWVEATAVVEEGRANPRQLWIRDQTVGGFAALVAQSRKAAAEALGPSHRPLLVLQLTHSGRYSRPGASPRRSSPTTPRSSTPSTSSARTIPLISDDELERLEDIYVEAARCAPRAGFDGVDVKACHRYLVSELLASHTREGSVTAARSKTARASCATWSQRSGTPCPACSSPPG